MADGDILDSGYLGNGSISHSGSTPETVITYELPSEDHRGTAEVVGVSGDAMSGNANRLGWKLLIQWERDGSTVNIETDTQDDAGTQPGGWGGASVSESGGDLLVAFDAVSGIRTAATMTGIVLEQALTAA